MNNLAFQQSRFLGSSLFYKKDFPFPYILIVGKSNSGKSSLINHLCQNKKLAHISSSPGKTQTINFFEIDKKLILIDLPGYGFSQVNLQKSKNWKQEIEFFLQKDKKKISLMLLLIDARHTFSQKDRLMYAWAKFYQLPILCILTKTDKFTKTSFEKSLQKVINSLPEDLPYISYSTKNLQFRKTLIKAISKNLKKEALT